MANNRNESIVSHHPGESQRFYRLAVAYDHNIREERWGGEVIDQDQSLTNEINWQE